MFGLVAVLAVGIVTLSYLVSPRKGSIRYHVEKLEQIALPSSRSLCRDAPSTLDNRGRPVRWMDYLRFRTWRWYWNGSYTPTKLVKTIEEHQQALIQLGYLERREFTFTNRSLSVQFFTMITNGVPANSVGLHLDETKDRWVRITARKVDMPIVERTVVAFDQPTKE